MAFCFEIGGKSRAWAGVAPAPLGLLLAAGLLVALWHPPARASEPITLSDAQLAKLDVRTATPVETAEIPLPGAPARVELPPSSERVLGAPRAGLVTRLAVAEGEAIVAGQVLAQLRSPDILTMQRSYLDAAAAFALARTQLERDRALARDGGVSQRRLQESETGFAAARAAMATAGQLLLGVGFDNAGLAALEHGGQLRPEIDLRAPIDGVVLARLATVGDQLAEGQPLYRIADLSRLWLNVALPAESVAEARIGLPVRVAGCDVTARVVLIGAVVAPSSQTVTLRAELEKPCPRLRPGQVVRAEVHVRHDGPVLMLPRAALVGSGGKDWVFVRAGKGFAAQEVRLAARGEASVYIAEGLDAHSEVAVSAIAVLKAAWVGLGGD